MKIAKQVGILVFMLLLVFSIAIAAPSRTTLQEGGAEQGIQPSSTVLTGGLGGATTTQDITTNSQTTAWQGFYGAVSKQMTLDDASNNTLYSWTFNAAIAGNVYASKINNVDWSNITAGTPASNASRSDDESETFTGTMNWTVNTNDLTDVPTVALYNSTGAGVWNEVLLNDNTNSEKIYGVALQNNQNCFNNVTCDFEMIVPATTASTIYYFYIELA